MLLITKEQQRQLQKQYPLGDSFDQKVIVKIFNPCGSQTWYLINQDPDDPDYLWCIADTFEVEVGSVLLSELQNIKVTPFNLGLERDYSFKPITVKEAYKRLKNGEKI